MRNSVADQPSAHGSEGETLHGHSSACTISWNMALVDSPRMDSKSIFLFLNFILTENTYY